MTTRRAEPFRYSMTPPVACQMQITGINGADITSKPAEVKMIDINKAGCRIQSVLDLKADIHQIHVAIHIQLNETPYSFTGEIRWQKVLDESGLNYGIAFNISEDEQHHIQVELRALAAARKIVVL